MLAKRLSSSSGNTCNSLSDAFCSLQAVFEVMKALAIVLVLGALLPVECSIVLQVQACFLQLMALFDSQFAELEFTRKHHQLTQDHHKIVRTDNFRFACS